MANAHWPIIYVRGYAMTRGEIDETTADPFCGFNLGSTVFRATTDKNKPQKFIFESPVVRLSAEHGYSCVFDGGLDIVDANWQKTCIPAKSIIIYRYYDEASRLLGSGKTPDIGKFAKDLGTLILQVRDLVCADEQNPIAKKDFRCYLVAHSMGGLVVRAFLHGPGGDDKARKCVDKVFTYATPHNGIEMGGINVPEWFGLNDVNNFSRENMAKYLGLKGLKGEEKKRVDWLPEEVFDSRKFFCMIGTNRADYEVAMGLSRSFSGHGSDGLVRIENASVWGIDKSGKVSEPCATAYAYRSHSGYFGIVNSEEAYQNLVRFLFGDVRVDVWLDVDSVRLPPKVQAQKDAGKKVNALFQFEVLAALRECRWYLTRRTAEEDSVACRTFEELESGDRSRRQIYLSTLYLSKKARAGRSLQSLAYSVFIGVRVPDYEVEKKLWLDDHFEGGYLFSDSARIEIMPPKQEGEAWNVVNSWQSDAGKDQADYSVPVKELKDRVVITLPFENPATPGITGKLRFVAREWNLAIE